ncbi:MAG: hypothetical protein HOV94_11095 [Saccharothrix sp.]|nr:hypothetical protein [Saccharothrix sp.]
MLRSTTVALVLATATVAGAGASASAPRWAPAGSAAIHPGVQMYTDGAQCTSHFVFTDRRSRVYVGYAAHCAGTGEATDTDGCKAGSLPLGTRVTFAEGGNPATDGTTLGHGRLVYSSWLTMRARGTRSADRCAYNDLALVRVGRAWADDVNPSVPFWGGPTSLAADPPADGTPAYSFGASSLRGGAAPLGPKRGVVLGSTGHGWSHDVVTVTPGVPGDSGSGFLDDHGRAFGTLSTLALAPVPASNGVGDLRHELAFARKHSGIPGLRLVPGTEPFDPAF